MSAAKRARKESAKSFDEYTVAELRELFKEHAALEKEAESARDIPDDSVVADRVKSAVAKQFLSQMLGEKELSEKEGGKLRSVAAREISIFVPNVAPEVMKTLGLDKTDDDGNIKGKRPATFFENVPRKGLAGGASLSLVNVLDFKHVARSKELKITATYKFLPKPKPKAKAVPKKRASGAEAPAEAPAEGTADEEGDAEQEEEEAGEVEGGEAKAGDGEAVEDAAPAASEGQNVD